MHLQLGDSGEPGPVLAHVTDAIWDQFTEREKRQRWLAFAGSNATVWLRLDIRDGRTVATGMLVGMAEPLSVAELRSIPLGRLVAIAATSGDDALRAAMPPEQLDREPPPALPSTTRKRAHPGRRGLSRADLEQVAQAWADARITHPHAPMKQAAARTSRSLAQTRRLVRRAEAAGLIPNDKESHHGE